jgi:hypothetical protein
MVRWRFVARSVAIGVLGLAIAYVAAMVVLQRRILFPLPSVAGAPERPKDAIQIWLPTAAGRIEAWYLPPVGARVAPSSAVVFFHGNGELIDFLPADFAEPRRWGMGVLLVEFPGYGRSGGTPSEQSITEVVLAAYDWTHAQRWSTHKRSSRMVDHLGAPLPRSWRASDQRRHFCSSPPSPACARLLTVSGFPNLQCSIHSIRSR